MVLPSIGDPDVLLILDVAAREDGLDRFPIVFVLFSLIKLGRDDGVWTDVGEHKGGRGIVEIGSHKVMEHGDSARLDGGDLAGGVEKGEVLVVMGKGCGAAQQIAPFPFGFSAGPAGCLAGGGPE